MYMSTDKMKEKTLSPIQKKTISCMSDHNDRKRKYNPIPRYIFNTADENHTSVKVAQLRAVSSYSDNAVIQLVHDDEVKILAESGGTDPTGTDSTRLGLTCHHIISGSLLRDFYHICIARSMDKKGKKIKNLLNRWQFYAVKNVNSAPDERRAGRVQAGPGHDVEVASACQWMCEDIFIGPTSSTRIDDPGDRFDYAAYRDYDESEGNPKRKRKIEESNRRVDRLRTINEQITYIVNQSRLNAINPERDYPIICGALSVLITVAQNERTLHEDDKIKKDAPAYNVNDWLSVGPTPIGHEMQHCNGMMRAMYERFLTINKKAINDRSEVEQEYYCIFCQHIPNRSQCAFLYVGDRKLTIARHNYNILVNAYRKLPVERRK